jgi:transketolase
VEERGDKVNSPQEVRELCLQTFKAGMRGHLPSALSLVDILFVLYSECLNVESANPFSPSRDRLILSKGHGCIALYATLASKDFFSKDFLDNFCAFDGALGGHPERYSLPGIEASTGSLGHGLAFGTGLAYSTRISGLEFNVWVILGDGELNEGSIWESAMAASHHQLSNLRVIIDANGMQASGETSTVWDLGNLVKKWEAFGFETRIVNGHDINELQTQFNEGSKSGKPLCFIAKTIKGYGIKTLESEPKWHHKSSVTDAEINSLETQLKHA